MTHYVVEIEPGCWLAPWSGDPGRTARMDSAKVFDDEAKAKAALARMVRDNTHRTLTRARVVKVTVTVSAVDEERVDVAALAARVAVLEAVIQSPPVPPPSDPENVRKALREAVVILWLDDSSDYRSALWTVVRLLWPGLPEEPDLHAMVKALDALGGES